MSVKSETQDKKAEELSAAAGYYRDLADLYRFYSVALLKELTDEQIEILADTEFPTDCEDLDEAQGYKWMRIYLNRRGSDARTDLAVDYARTFLAAGTYEGDTAVPYESVYLSEEGLLMQEPRDEVVLEYRKYGFQVNPELHTPEDHAGFELEFASMLCDRIADAIEKGDRYDADLQELTEFIDKHLLSWLPQLKERVDNFAELRFYPAMVRIIIGTLRGNQAANADLKALG